MGEKLSVGLLKVRCQLVVCSGAMVHVNVNEKIFRKTLDASASVGICAAGSGIY